jgi:mannose-6-phosphate isomerase-like protein (cupin superfamily)
MTDGPGSSPRRPVVLGPGEGREYPMGRLSATVKADGEETGHRYHLAEWRLEPHTKGPGSHVHEEDDVFIVLEGTLHVMVGGEWTAAATGSVVIAPGGEAHDFENRSDEVARFLNVSAPGDFEEHLVGIAQWFRDRSDEDSRTV